MNKKYTILIAVVAILYIVYHIATLIYSPLPWFDEVSFASITESYMKNHTFYEDPRILVLPDQKLNYGPIYFVIQSFILKTFGFGIFNFRIINLLFGFIDLWLIYKICLKLRFTIPAALITVLMVAVEPNYNQFLHSGRMDYIMLFFFMNAYLVYITIDAAKKSTFVFNSLLVGLLLCCSFLTNPRIIFAFSAFVCFFIYELIAGKAYAKKMAFLKFTLIAVAFCAIYYIWIYKAYGSIGGYIYENYQKSSSVMKEHLGFGSYFVLRYNLIILLYAVALFVLLIKNRILIRNIDLVLLCFPVCIAFIFIVSGGVSGRYYALVAPFVSIFIVGITVDILNNKFLKYINYAICAMFGAVFIFKTFFILATLEQHDPYRNEQAISKFISKNSSVCGDFMYYYIARNNGCSFLSIEENGSPQSKMAEFIRRKTRYFIISTGNRNRKEFESYLVGQYKLVTIVEDIKISNAFSRIIKKLPYAINEGYACYIYEYTGQ